MQPEARQQSLSIPIAIIIAGALIGFGIYWSGRGQTAQAPVANNNAPKEVDMAPVSANDHILGDRNAKIVLVEYSDTECPFCKNFHNTLNLLMQDYGAKGDLAWVYRHFPIPQLHSKAQKEAEATECAAEQGGNAAFWKYINRLYEITPSNDGLDPAKLSEIATFAGLDAAKFDQCLASGKHTKKVQDQAADAVRAGGEGTPYSVLLVDGQKIPITQGALPYSDMKTIIDSILKNS